MVFFDLSAPPGKSVIAAELINSSSICEQIPTRAVTDMTLLADVKQTQSASQKRAFNALKHATFSTH